MCKIGQIITFFVFAFMAGGHWVRYFMDYTMTIHHWTIPVVWSLPVAIFFTFMAVWVAWGFKCTCKCCKRDED